MTRARHAGGPRHGRRRHLHRRRAQRPHRRLARTPTAPRSCSAATAGSCCPPAATSRRSSTRRRPTRAPATASRTSNPPDPQALLERGADAPRQLVARLRRLARAALRASCSAGAEDGSAAAATRRSAKAPGHVRPRDVIEQRPTPDPARRGWAGRSARRAGCSRRPGCRGPRRLRPRRAARRRPRRWCSSRASWRRRLHAAALRRWLRRIGYRAAVCGFVAQRRLRGARARARGAACARPCTRRSGRRVAIVGHSRGGHFARARRGAPARARLARRSRWAPTCRGCSHAARRRSPRSRARAAACTSPAAPRPRRASARAAAARSPRLHRAVPGRPRAPDLASTARATASCAGRRDRPVGRLRRGHWQPRRPDVQPQGYRVIAEALARPELTP